MNRRIVPLLKATALAVAFAGVIPASASAAAPAGAAQADASGPVSRDARAILDAMTTYLRGLDSFSIESRSSRDEVVEFGYKLQNNEHATLLVQRPNKLRADVQGDVRNRSYVYDGAKLGIYSADDDAFISTPAPDTIAKLLDYLLDAGVEMPLMDVLYQGANGTLTDAVRGGILVGDSIVDGVECDHLAFRQSNVDWQLWVEKGARPLPRKIVITTRYEVGDPQFQAVLDWNLKPAITPTTFAFAPPKDATEVPFNSPSPAPTGEKK